MMGRETQILRDSESQSSPPISGTRIGLDGEASGVDREKEKAKRLLDATERSVKRPDCPIPGLD